MNKFLHNGNGFTDLPLTMCNINIQEWKVCDSEMF